MGRHSTAEKILSLLTALGTLLVVVALALFAFAGSGFGSGILRSVAGGVLGMFVVAVLTRSPQRGRRVAALLLLISVLGFLALLLVVVAPGLAGQGRDDPEFVVGFLGFAMGASLARMVGVDFLGPRGDQASRRRS